MTRSQGIFSKWRRWAYAVFIALEKYEEESGDKDFIILCEGGTDMFKGRPHYINVHTILAQKSFESEIKHRQVKSNLT